MKCVYNTNFVMLGILFYVKQPFLHDAVAGAGGTFLVKFVSLIFLIPSSRGGLEEERMTLFTQVYDLLRWIKSRLGLSMVHGRYYY